VKSLQKSKSLKTCSSTSKSTTDDQQQIEELTQTVRSLPPNYHYSPRPEKNKRNLRSKKLHRIKQIQNHLSSPYVNAQGTTEEVLQQNSANPALMKAIQDIKHIVPDQPLKKQLDDMYTKTRQAITSTDALNNKKDNKIARKKQQQLINKTRKKPSKGNY
jgi:hypothetical protein